MFFSLQTVVIDNIEQRVVLEITRRSNKWSVIRCHQWHPSDMWWPHVTCDMSHLMRLCRDDCQLWYWSDHGLVTRLQLHRWGHHLGHYHHHCHCHPVISCHWYGTKWWASLWFSKLAHDYLKHDLRQSWTKRSLPDLESNELFRNLSVHGLRRVLCHWNWLPGVLIQQHHLRVGWNIIMNAALQPGAQHLSVTRAYLMKYNSIIHTSLQLDKSPLNTLLSAEACLVVSWSMATI